MSEYIKLVSPNSIKPNPENPRLIFHQEELDALQESIEQQGILVPLTVYPEGQGYRIIDGERRWRCSLKLGLPQIPVIIQPKPERLQNLMMMFAIHHRRDEWDPLPTAMKLQVLEELFEEHNGSRPTERQLAEVASLTVGEVRRYRKLLGLPEKYKSMLMSELEKPRSQQKVTVDVVLEATAAATALNKRAIIKEEQEDEFRMSIIEKFRSGVIESTVDPRLFSRFARAVEREEIDLEVAKSATTRFLNRPNYSIRQLFNETTEEADFKHKVNIAISRVCDYLEEIESKGYTLDAAIYEQLKRLRKLIGRIG